MSLKSTLSEIKNKPKFQFYWFILITVLGLLLSQLLDKFMGKATEMSLGKGISLAEVIIAIIIVITSIISIISIAVVYNNYMKHVQKAHENCMSRVIAAHENCKIRAQDAHINCENHVHKLKTTVLYKEEIFSTEGISSDDFGNNKPAGYNILADYIKKAENRILQVTSAPFGNLEEADYPSRKEYFETLVKKIESKKNNSNFRYVRIHQVQNINNQLPAIDVVTKKFYEDVINIATRYRNIGLLKVETNRLYGFTIIDEKYLIIQMSGLKNEKVPVESGIFIFDDYDGSSIIKDFLRYFESIYTKHETKPIALVELKEKEI
jgi:hypothetical protein